MDKKWVEKQKAINLEKYEEEMESVVDKIQSCDFISKEKEKSILSLLSDEGMQVFNEVDDILHYIGIDYIRNSEDDVFEKYADWRNSLGILHLADLKEKTTDGYYKDCLDSKPVEFDGDIIITDPIYIAKDPDYSTEPEAEAEHSHGNFSEHDDYAEGMLPTRNTEGTPFLEDLKGSKPCVSYDFSYFLTEGDLKPLGFSKWINRYNLYGDWRCVVYNPDSNEKIGRFTSDSGLVGVFLLNEVLRYNPDFSYITEDTHTTTIVRDFKGTVQCVVEGHEEDKSHISYNMRIIGNGINKKSGEKIHFTTKQIGA